MEKQISVIVPMYKCEKYIANLVTQLLRYRGEDIEFIFVNDGSPDNSLEIVKEFQTDSRIKIVDKDNGGVSSARNAGIKVAVGKYIWFVDSDDTIADNALETLNGKIKEKEYDIFLFDYILKNKMVKNIEDNCFEIIVQANEYIIKMNLERKIKNSCCFCLFSRKIIIDNNLKFNEEMTNGEDGVFLLNYSDKIKTAFYIKKALYIYNLEVGTSATSNITPSVFKSLELAYKTRKKYIEKYMPEFLEKQRSILLYSLFKNFFNIKANKNVSNEETKIWIKKMTDNEYLQNEFLSVNKKRLSLISKIFIYLYKNRKINLIYTYISIVFSFYKFLAFVPGLRTKIKSKIE